MTPCPRNEGLREQDSSEARDRAPSAQEIEQRFRSPLVLALRPVLWASLYGLMAVRRFGWKAQFDVDLKSIEGPMVFASNHRSHADTAAILGTMPQFICRRTCVAAALDVFGPDSKGGLRRKISKDLLQLSTAAGFHGFAFDRFGPPLRSVRTSVQLIRHNWNLLLYPEGTRSRDGEMGQFKAGVGVLARFTQRPVIPVFVDGGESILPYGAFMPRGAFAIVRYGAPMFYADDDTPQSFADRLQGEVRRLGQRQARAVAKLAHMSAHPFFTARKQPA
jgi:1-acyl-sn-glycerol-3-phosphate acyltransferase